MEILKQYILFIKNNKIKSNPKQIMKIEILKKNQQTTYRCTPIYSAFMNFS